MNEDARDRWEHDFAIAYRRCRQAVVTELNRMGVRSPLAGFVDENQARGVLHRNLIVEDGPAGLAFHKLWIKHARRFPALGFVDRKAVTLEGLSAGAYVASYITGAKGESSMQARLLRSRAHVRIYAISPRLTGRSLVTMRAMRMGRRLWACANRGAPAVRAGCRCRRFHPTLCPGRLGVFNGRVIDAATGEIIRDSIWDLGP